MKQTKNKCYICGRDIDKSDPSKSWVTITQKCYWPEDTKVHGRKILLCQLCGRVIINKVDLEEIEKRSETKWKQN